MYVSYSLIHCLTRLNSFLHCRAQINYEFYIVQICCCWICWISWLSSSYCWFWLVFVSILTINVCKNEPDLCTPLALDLSRCIVEVLLVIVLDYQFLGEVIDWWALFNVLLRRFDCQVSSRSFVCWADLHLDNVMRTWYYSGGKMPE